MPQGVESMTCMKKLYQQRASQPLLDDKGRDEVEGALCIHGFSPLPLPTSSLSREASRITVSNV